MSEGLVGKITQLTNCHCHAKLPSSDPLVDEAVELLRGAADILEAHNIYNNGINYTDYLPNGLRSAVDRLIEPFVRVCVSGSEDQKKDVLGYAALFTVCAAHRFPPSMFADIVQRFEAEFWKAMKTLECGEYKPR